MAARPIIITTSVTPTASPEENFITELYKYKKANDIADAICRNSLSELMAYVDDIKSDDEFLKLVHETVSRSRTEPVLIGSGVNCIRSEDVLYFLTRNKNKNALIHLLESLIIYNSDGGNNDAIRATSRLINPLDLPPILISVLNTLAALVVLEQQVELKRRMEDVKMILEGETKGEEEEEELIPYTSGELKTAIINSLIPFLGLPIDESPKSLTEAYKDILLLINNDDQKLDLIKKMSLLENDEINNIGIEWLLLSKKV